MRSREFQSKALENLARNRNTTVSDLAESIPAIAKLAKNVAKAGASTAKTGTDSNMTPAEKIAKKTAKKGSQELEKKVLKPGAKLPIPTKKGNQPQEFEVDNVRGDEVTLTNPNPKPGDPVKTVHKKKDLDPLLKKLAGKQ